MKNAMQLGFFFDQTRCSGCYTCVLACRQWHSIENEVMNWRRVETFENGTFPDVKVSFLSLSCMHCQTPSCVSSCPVSAIFKREKDGIVLVDSEKCLGEPDCGLCKKACPYQIPQFNPNLDLKMEKCNLCLDRLDESKRPICVDACPMHALDVAPLNELSRRCGHGKRAQNFTYFETTKPSIILRGKHDIGCFG